MELVPYTDDDLWLLEAMETDPRVMADLGGPWPADEIPKIHARRLEHGMAGRGTSRSSPSPVPRRSAP